MPDKVRVSAARTPDRDRLLKELVDAGLAASPVGDIGIEVLCGDNRASVTDALFKRVERLIMSVGAPFVPIKHEGVIYIRPPVG